MSNGSKPAAAGVKQEETSNALIQSVDSLAISTTKQFEVNIFGCMTDCNFYISDATADNTGLAFRAAYHFAVNSKNNKEICACVGSMLCSVVPGFKSSVVEALKATGINPCFASLPSQAHQNSIVDSEIPQMDWPSVLVIFGYWIILLFERYIIDSSHYNNRISNSIRELQVKVKCDPSKKLDIPFDYAKAYAISTMIDSSDLCEAVKKFLKNSSNHPNSQIRNMCKYVSHYADS